MRPRAETWNALLSDLESQAGPEESSSPGVGRHRRRQPSGPSTFLAQITGNASLSANRWKYAWSEVELDANGAATRAGLRTGTTTLNPALNLIEINNAATGVRGNGVNQSGAAYPATFSLKPAGTGGFALIVLMHECFDKQGALRYVFQYENADDGTCS